MLRLIINPQNFLNFNRDENNGTEIELSDGTRQTIRSVNLLDYFPDCYYTLIGYPNLHFIQNGEIMFVDNSTYIIIKMKDVDAYFLILNSNLETTFNCVR